MSKGRNQNLKGRISKIVRGKFKRVWGPLGGQIQWQSQESVNGDFGSRERSSLGERQRGPKAKGDLKGQRSTLLDCQDRICSICGQSPGKNAGGERGGGTENQSDGKKGAKRKVVPIVGLEKAKPCSWNGMKYTEGNDRSEIAGPHTSGGRKVGNGTGKAYAINLEE